MNIDAAKILVLNAGSSSIKFRLYNKSDATVIAEGLCERIGIDGVFHMKVMIPQVHKIEEPGQFSDHEAALSHLFAAFNHAKLIANNDEIVGVGHRIVQGGSYFTDSVVIDHTALKKIKDLIPLAPLHNEPEAKIIEIVQKLLPKAQNVAVFDTAFHSTIKAVNKTYPICQKIAKKYQIARYGFHGTSYKYITKQMLAITQRKHLNLIVCHLGNGASICAIENNQSINTSMGFTPLEGLVMGTRSGDVDPSIITFLGQQREFNMQQINEMLHKNSGLLALSGCADMRDVIAKAKANDHDGKLALALFIKRVADYVVKYANELKGEIDAIVFTAGIGENASLIRELSVEACSLLNLALDYKANAQKYDNHLLISAPQSKYPIYVVRTNEELMIFEDVKRLIK